MYLVFSKNFSLKRFCLKIKFEKSRRKTISISTRAPMTTRLGKMVTCLEGLLSIKSYDALITWSCKITSQTKNLYQYNTYGHQSWQGGDIQSVVTCSFNHMVLWGHVTNSICHTSTCTRPMVTKHGKVVTYCESLLPINSQNPVNMGHVMSRDKLTTFYLHYHNAYGHLTRPSGDLTRGAPIHKLAWLLNEAVLWGQVTN